jgi:hypothetical protein
VGSDRLTAYLTRALEVTLERVVVAAEGRDASLNKAAYSLGRLVHYGVFSEAQLRAALVQAAGEAGFDESFTAAKAKYTVKRSVRQGMLRPRTIGLGDDGRVEIPPPPPRPAAPPSRPRPDVAEVAELWARCVPVYQDDGVASWLESRRFAVDHVADTDLCRALPEGADVPRWASGPGGLWPETGHRLVFRAHGPDGVASSLRARCIVADVAPAQKAFAAAAGMGSARGLCLADAVGVQMLQGAARPGRVFVAEGETSFLRAVLARDMTPALAGLAVLGVWAGAWTPDLSARVPAGVPVVVGTDNDGAGDRYARAVSVVLAGKCPVRRVRLG